MARCHQRITIIGHLGADPETRYAAGGSAITTIRVAVTEKWKDKTTQEQKEHTEWMRCTFFGKSAEIAGEYLKKGALVYLEGKMRTQKYTDKEGIERWSVDIIVQQMNMLDRRKEGEGGSAPKGAPGGPPPPDAGFEDDDIPF